MRLPVISSGVVRKHHAQHPAIAAAMRKERALLSSFSILADDGETQAA